MLAIKLNDEALQVIQTLLKEEDDDDACVRIREYQTGTPCCRKIILGLTIDEKEDEDVAIDVNGLPFVVSQDLIDQYGENFSIALDGNKQPSVTAE